jgi:hypothetical protein
MGLQPSPETLTRNAIGRSKERSTSVVALLCSFQWPALLSRTGRASAGGGFETAWAALSLDLASAGLSNRERAERLALPHSRAGPTRGSHKAQMQASSDRGPARLALPGSEIPQELGNWQVRRRPRQRKERGDQDPRPPIVIGRHASAPITGIAAKRARVR